MATATTYPENPNGAELSCAALTDETGHVFGLMPHPEAFLSLYNHPNWGQLKRQNPNLPDEGAGLQIFKNIVAHLNTCKLPNAEMVYTIHNKKTPAYLGQVFFVTSFFLVRLVSSMPRWGLVR